MSEASAPSPLIPVPRGPLPEVPPARARRQVEISIDGKTVSSSEDVATDIAAKKAGQTVAVGLLRGNGKGGYQKKTVKVTLASRPNSVPNPTTPEG